jgi:hypothetical protein
VDLFAAEDIVGPCLSRHGCSVAVAGVRALGMASLDNRPGHASRRFGATLGLGSCLDEPALLLPSFHYGRWICGGADGASASPILHRQQDGSFVPPPAYPSAETTEPVGRVPLESAARMARLFGAAKASDFVMPRIRPDGSIPSAVTACAGSDCKGRLAWRADYCFPNLDPWTWCTRRRSTPSSSQSSSAAIARSSTAWAPNPALD